MTDLLTDKEHALVKKLGECAGEFSDILEHNQSRINDAAEFITLIHFLQRFVMSQAAAREYPEIYRMLGGQGLVNEDG